MDKRRIAVRGIVVKDGKLLCVRQKAYNGRATNDANDYWCTPGGGVDVGESLIPALERELVEETGVKPVVGNLLYIQQFSNKETEHIEFFFHVENAEDYMSIDLNSTSHGAIEIAQIDFIDTSEHKVMPTFLMNTDLTTDATRGTTTIFNNIG